MLQPSIAVRFASDTIRGLDVNFASPPNDDFHESGIYKPLNRDRKEIRLLRILPGLAGTPVECELVQNVSLTDARQQMTRLREVDDEAKPNKLIDETAKQSPPGFVYYGLSYAAGNLTDTAPIKLDGIEFNVFATLATALSNYSEPENSTQWWVDQLCINQADSSEREYQVSLMGEIYASAYAVVVWLGDVGGEGQAAAQWAADLVTCAQDAREQIGKPYWGTDESTRVVSSAVTKYINDRPMLDPDLCLAWIKARWFQRAWTIQETASSKVVMLHWQTGGNSIQQLVWEQFTLVYMALEAAVASAIFVPSEEQLRLDQAHCIGTAISSASNMRDLVKNFRLQDLDQLQWEHVLNRSRAQGCSDARDHVYSMFNLVDPGQRTRLKPDYTCPANVTFGRAVQAIVERQGMLDVLAYTAKSSPDSTPGLSSWVPDFAKVSLETTSS